MRNARIARTEGTWSAASCSANNSAACSCSGSASCSVWVPSDRYLGTADDHHEEFVRAHQRDRWPRGHRRAGRPWPRPWATLAASVATMPSPSSHRASAGTGVLRRAESSIAATAATSSTASAVDQRMTRSAAFTTQLHQATGTPPKAAMGFLVQSPCTD